jgi:hypothetical protein
MTQRKGTPTSHTEDAPKKPERWRSACDLENEYVGGSTDIKRFLETLRNALIGDVMVSNQCSLQEATDLVDTHLIGLRKPRRGPEALAASPDAQRLLGLTKRTEAGPPKPEGWKTAMELSRSHRAGCVTISLRLERLRARLISDLVDAGYGETAQALVENHLIGNKKPAYGQVTITASPDAIRLAEEMELIEPRVLSR